MDKLENRIPPPIVLIVSLMTMKLLASIGPVIDIDFKLKLLLSSAIVLIGLVFMFAGVLRFRRVKTTINPLSPDQASDLVVEGVYRLSRNPMYLGMALISVAWVIFLASPWSLLGVIGFVLFINRFQITPEERAMADLFGIKYAQYKAKVRRWF